MATTSLKCHVNLSRMSRDISLITILKHNFNTQTARRVFRQNHLLSPRSQPGFAGQRSRLVLGLGLHNYKLEKNYSSGSDPYVKGYVFPIPRPFLWIRKKWFTYMVKSYVDPSFSLEDFSLGAEQALTHVTRLAAGSDYEEMKEIATSEAISRIRDMMTHLTTEQQDNIEVNQEDIHVCHPVITRFDYHNSLRLYELDINVYYLAVKLLGAKPIFLQVSFKFCRKYGQTEASDWTITDATDLSAFDV